MDPVFHRAILSHLFTLITFLSDELLMRFFEEFLSHGPLFIVIHQSFLLARMFQGPNVLLVDRFGRLFRSCSVLKYILVADTHARLGAEFALVRYDSGLKLLARLHLIYLLS